MTKALVIELVGEDVSICLTNGQEVSVDEEVSTALAHCRASGDVEEACAYVRDHLGVDFRTIARNEATGEYENREASGEEKQAACEAIYFESSTDFSDEGNAELYLIWEAASRVED